MSRTFLAALALLAALACAPEAGEAPVAPPPAEKQFHEQQPNLLTLLAGATVVDRTGEASLSLSAINAIDGDPTSVWATPPDDLEQSITIALPGTAVIRRVGIDFGALQDVRLARELLFEASADGESFSPVGTLQAEKRPVNWLEVDPVQARFLRATILGTFADAAPFAQVPELLADGDASPPAEPPSLRGRWRINEFEATISGSGAIVHGVTTETPPRVFRGAWDGRSARLAWSRGAEHGVALLTATSTGDRLNARVWYRQAHGPFEAPSWFGERIGEPAGGMRAPEVSDAFFRAGRGFPLYDLVFDGPALAPGMEPAVDRLARLIAANPPGTFRLAAHQVGRGTESDDVALATARLETLKQALRNRGVPPERAGYDAAARRDFRDLPWTGSQLLLNNRIDLELARTGGQ